MLEEYQLLFEQSANESRMKNMNNYQPLTLEKLKSKSIIIFGMAREGISTYHFLRKNLPEQKITLADGKTLTELPEVKKLIDEDQLVSYQQINQNIDWDNYDLIFKSAGIPFAKYNLPTEKITSNTQLFFNLAPGKIIGVTGTKGKSTTTAMIAQMLNIVGLDAKLAGNIGLPLLETLEDSSPNTYFVCELSSHQLEFLQSSPKIAIIQTIVPEHLDYYHSFDRYIEAKSHITKFQTKDDLLIYNSDSKVVDQIADQSKATKKPFNHLSIESLLTELNINKEDLPLAGKHNLLNITPAILIGQYLGISPEKIKKAILSFQPLAHRLELVADIDGVKYYNDSLATNPEATIAGIEAFVNKPLVLISGGFDRGLSYDKLAEKINQSNIKKLILFKDTGIKINQYLDQLGSQIDREFADSMQQAMFLAKTIAQDGDVVLMSPASASFNMFKDYADRGEQFKKLVRE